MSDWGVQTVEHTFSSGRSATVRKSFPLMALVREGLLTEELLSAFDAAKVGGLSDATRAVELVDVIVKGMFVSPRIVLGADAEVLEGECPIGALSDDELTETCELAFAAAEGAARFRDDVDGDGVGVDGADVGDEAERVLGDGSGERGGVRAGQSVGRKATAAGGRKRG